MKETEKKPEISPQEAKKLLSTPEARQLMALLSKDGGQSLQRAAAELRRGNTAGVQEVLKPLVETPEADALLKKLSRK